MVNIFTIRRQRVTRFPYLMDQFQNSFPLKAPFEARFSVQLFFVRTLAFAPGIQAMDSPVKQSHPHRPTPNRTSPTKPKHTAHRRPYQKYVDVDLAPYMRVVEHAKSIRAASKQMKHLSLTRLNRLYHQWCDAGRPSPFIRKETRGRHRAFTQQVGAFMHVLTRACCLLPMLCSFCRKKPFCTIASSMKSKPNASHTTNTSNHSLSLHTRSSLIVLHTLLLVGNNRKDFPPRFARRRWPSAIVK
jgi:hypothetical protein